MSIEILRRATADTDYTIRRWVVKIVDRLIVSPNERFSFRKEGLI
jgi:hypothetical protein